MKSYHFLTVILVFWLISFLSATGTAHAENSTCAFQQPVADLLAQTQSWSWANWIEALSGAKSVSIGDETTRITTRYSYPMFSGETNARAFEYILEQVALLTPANPVELDDFIYKTYTWKNLIVELPGAVHPDQVVILSAHLDSTSSDPLHNAPGAEDNASGSAALLEALRVLRTQQFEKTLRFIWFTGEEQGLKGSIAYVTDHSMTGVTGVINLDMFGYDSNNDRCFELHVGSLAASQEIGSCFVSVNQAYNLGLSMDYITANPTYSSDHASFWNKSVGAVEVLENFSNQNLVGGCVGSDKNPYYHTINDTIGQMNISSGFAITQAALASAASLAVPLGSCFESSPQLNVDYQPASVNLTWTAVTDASAYRVLRSTASCNGPWEQVAEVTGTSWSRGFTGDAPKEIYRVDARDGTCYSIPSNCVNNFEKHFLPQIFK